VRASQAEPRQRMFNNKRHNVKTTKGETHATYDIPFHWDRASFGDCVIGTAGKDGL
jgi:hypothetical protein